MKNESKADFYLVHSKLKKLETLGWRDSLAVKSTAILIEDWI